MGSPPNLTLTRDFRMGSIRVRAPPLAVQAGLQVPSDCMSPICRSGARPSSRGAPRGIHVAYWGPGNRLHLHPGAAEHVARHSGVVEQKEPPRPTNCGWRVARASPSFDVLRGRLVHLLRGAPVDDVVGPPPIIDSSSGPRGGVENARRGKHGVEGPHVRVAGRGPPRCRSRTGGETWSLTAAGPSSPRKLQAFSGQAPSDRYQPCGGHRPATMWVAQYPVEPKTTFRRPGSLDGLPIECLGIMAVVHDEQRGCRRTLTTPVTRPTVRGFATPQVRRGRVHVKRNGRCACAAG